jgi:hypothetical protein
MIEEDYTRVKIAGAVIAVFLIGWMIYSIATYRRYTQATVVQINWQLEIARQQYMTVYENDWHLPIDGRLDHTNREIRSYERYISGWHYETKSGGTYSCGTRRNPKTCRYPDKQVKVNEYSSRPVWDTKYYYYIDKWMNIAPLVSSGNTKETVKWPDTTDSTYNDTPVIGNVKLGLKTSHFWIVVISDEQKQYDLDLVEITWRDYYVGKRAKLTLGFFGNVIGVD